MNLNKTVAHQDMWGDDDKEEEKDDDKLGESEEQGNTEEEVISIPSPTQVHKYFCVGVHCFHCTIFLARIWYLFSVFSRN